VQLIPDFLTPHNVEFILRWADKNDGWTRGRQGTGYEIMAVKDEPDFGGLVQRAILRLGPYFEDFYDAYLIRYRQGDFIPPHKDEAALPGKRHRRVNAMVAPAGAGGELRIGGRAIDLPVGTAVDFFPDEEEHEVTPVTEGRRILFSVGCWQ
jgi:predicted 2-oxoglutarate/Fe(II)-dependent dioxygenase YbiX